MIYDVRRTRGIAVVMLTTAVIMAIYGLILRATLGRADKWLYEYGEATSTSVEFRNGGGLRRIRGVVHSLQRQPLQPERRLGLLVGPSQLYDGIDPEHLGASLGGPHRWANITCSHLAQENLLMAQLIYSNGLRPDVLILVGSPGMLVADADTAEERGWYDPRILFHHLARRRFREAKDDILQISYTPFRVAFPYRAQVCTLVERNLFTAKLRLFQAWGSGLDSLCAPDPDPWVEPYNPQELRRTPETNRIILEGLENLGWFDPARYRSDSQSFRSIAAIFRRAHANHTRSFLVLAPESSAYRAKLPTDNAFHLEHTLSEVLGEAAPVVLDFRASAPDQDFANVNHLNPEGRVRMTERLATALKPYIE